MKKYFFSIFIFLSFITQTIAEPGANAILSRLTFSDIFGALGLLFGINSLLQGFLSSMGVSRIFQAALFLILAFFLPVMFSLKIQSTLVECLILFFLVLIAISLFQIFKDSLLISLLPLLIYTLIVASLLGFYDLFASNVGLSRIFPGRSDGEALSGFRNAGQAGAYYLVMLSILIPLRYSKLYNLLETFHKRLLQIAIVLSIVFIFLTGKIAAYIGLACGILFFLIYKRNLRVIIGVCVGGLLLSFLWINLEVIMPSTYKRISGKYRTRITGNIDGTNKNEFLTNNYGNAIQAFEDRPLIGSGLGGFTGNYDEHEVHSTYFKMIGETGLIGTIAYISFVIVLLTLFSIRRQKNENPYADFLASMYPFILGCFISWAYTYHLRKREFWILIVTILIANYAAKQFNESKNKINHKISETPL